MLTFTFQYQRTIVRNIKKIATTTAIPRSNPTNPPPPLLAPFIISPIGFTKIELITDQVRIVAEDDLQSGNPRHKPAAAIR